MAFETLTPDYADPKEGSKRRVHVPGQVTKMV